MTSRPSLSAEALASWDANATYWDDAITRDGNKYWRRLQEPSLQRLLGPKLLVANSGLGGLRALEFATGNGLCTRWLAREMRRQNLGHHCDILATDGSEEMLKTARRHFLEEYGEEEGERGGVSTRWRRVDVTSKEDLDTLVKEEGRFDIILINMALMDVADLQPLAKAVSNLLALNGVFVATVLHPAFVTSNASRHLEIRNNPETGELEIIRGKIIREYMSVPPYKGVAVPGQPQKQIYFHRTMQDLFLPFFAVGLVMDALEELAFDKEDAVERIEASSNYTQLPFILSFRMKRP